MKKYRVKVAIPSTENRWEARAEERTLEVENFNQMLMRAVTADELKAGARIFEIEELPIMVKSFYFPLTIYDHCGYDEAEELNDMLALIYRPYIEHALTEYQGKDSDMARYFDSYYSETASKKAKHIWWGFEQANNRLFGKVEVALTEELTAEETEIIKDWITGQNSDGLGEGFEQREFKAGSRTISVSFWNPGDDYCIYDEKEFCLVRKIQQMEENGQ